MELKDDFIVVFPTDKRIFIHVQEISFFSLILSYINIINNCSIAFKLYAWNFTTRLVIALLLSPLIQRPLIKLFFQ